MDKISDRVFIHRVECHRDKKLEVVKSLAQLLLKKRQRFRDILSRYCKVYQIYIDIDESLTSETCLVSITALVSIADLKSKIKIQEEAIPLLKTILF